MHTWIHRWEQLTDQNKTLGFLRIMLAGVSQIVWNTHPLCALILLSALASACPVQFLSCLWALVIAAAMTLLLRLPKDLTMDGLYTINPALAGIAVPLVFFQNSSDNLPALLFACTGASVLSVLLCVLLRKWTGPRQLSPLGLPYSITLLLMGLCVRLTQASSSAPASAGEMVWDVHIYLHAVFCALAQVIWVEGVPNAPLAGLLTLLGIFVVSRIDGIIALYSAVLFTAAAMFLRLDPNVIQLGLYGYGAVLLSMVLFGRAYRMSKYSFLLITVFSVLSAPATAAVRPLFAAAGAPVAATVWSVLALAAMGLRHFTKRLVFIVPAHWSIPENSSTPADRR